MRGDSRNSLTMHPLASDWLISIGLASSGDFVDLPGEIVSGHVDRHVREVKLGGRIVYLKREHRIRNRVSLSEHEGKILAELESQSLPAPQWLAFGIDGGRAFLLVEAIQGVELRRTSCDPERLGHEIARVHHSGFTTPDLSAKHVFVSDEGITFLDWQRSRRRKPSTSERIVTIAFLNSTWVHASPQERQSMFAAYHRGWSVLSLSEFITAIETETSRLMQHRSVQRQRQPIDDAPRRLVWLDGEAVCAVPAHASDVRAIMPRLYPGDNTVSSIVLPSGVKAKLVCRRMRCALRRMMGRRVRAVEMSEARRLFESSDPTELLAFGQRLTRFGCESFLLTEERAA